MKFNEIINEDQFLWEMANLTKRLTGLPMNIYVSSKDSVKDRHGPRIKAMSEHGNKFIRELLSSVSISSTPMDYHNKLNNKDLKLVQEWILLNKKALLSFWNNKLDIGELINILEKN